MVTTELSLIYVTCSNKDEAKKIAKKLVSLKLVACANVIKDIESVYEYKGKLHDDNEAILLLKTKSTLFKDIKNKVIELHSYDLPCIIEIPIRNSHKKFMNWIISNTVTSFLQ